MRTMCSGSGEGIPKEEVVNHSFWALVCKRGLDLFFATLLLILVSPLLVSISLVIKWSCPGPILYRGLRCGLNGKTFRILKFRTMVVDAEVQGGPTTGTNDSRVTTVGALLRRTKLDELPQLLNVLSGDMSLVGPRPEVLQYTSQYVGEEQLILSMRPGITDYSSVKFANLDDIVGNIDPDEYFREHVLPIKNSLRVKYVKEWSLVSDAKILWLTCITVFKKSLFW